MWRKPMRKLLFIISIAAFWLLGYYCGRQDGFPDLLGWAQSAVAQARQAGADQAAEDAFQAAQRGLLALVSPTDQATPVVNTEPQPLSAEQPDPQAQPPPKSKRPAVPTCW